MFSRKFKTILNCLQPAEKTPFLRVFWATEARRAWSADAHDRKEPRQLRAWIRSSEKSERRRTFLQAEYLRPTRVAGVHRGGEKRQKGDRGNSFQFVFSLVYNSIISTLKFAKRKEYYKNKPNKKAKLANKTKRHALTTMDTTIHFKLEMS